jgi:hypothetical protein
MHALAQFMRYMFFVKGIFMLFLLPPAFFIIYILSGMQSIIKGKNEEEGEIGGKQSPIYSLCMP